METTERAAADCPCRKKTDRYVTFRDIDCDGNARRVVACIERHLAAGRGNGFWDYFLAKRRPRSGPAPDELFLVHAHLNQIRELFEDCGDDAALELLTQVEEECC